MEAESRKSFVSFRLNEGEAGSSSYSISLKEA